MITLDYQSRVPIYRQIENRILELILLGVYTSDAQLPSVRTLAVDLGINPNTIQKAYQELESDGIIYTVTGKGSFVKGVGEARSQLQNKAAHSVEAALREAHLANLPSTTVHRMVDQEYGEVKHHD